MTEVRVSIVIPMRNAARYIRETLDGVRKQTCREWELFVVDDGCDDSSPRIVADYFASHPGMGQLLSHPRRENRGTSASRNLGLQQARGELICFLDADDVWEERFLESFLQVFDGFPDLSMVYCPALLWHSDPDLGEDRPQRLGVRPDRVVDSMLLFRRFLNGRADTPSPSGVMFRRAALLRAGGWEAQFRDMYDDQVLYSKVLLDGTAYVAGSCLYRYRQHAESLCRVADRERQEPLKRKLYLEWLRQYLKERGKLTRDLSLLLTEQLWYVERRLEKEGREQPRKGTLGALLELCSLQPDLASALQLSWRIAQSHALYLVEKAKAGR